MFSFMLISCFMFYVSLNERIVSRNHWLNFMPMVAVVSSKPPREGAVGSYISSVIRFTFFRPPTPPSDYTIAYFSAECCLIFSQ